MISDRLLSMAEPMPHWLEAFRPGDLFDRTAFFSSRIVYYPGAAHDSHAIRFFNSIRSAHSFIYVDYGFSSWRTESEIRRVVNDLPDYNILDLIRFPINELIPREWQPHASWRRYSSSHVRGGSMMCGYMAIVEKTRAPDEKHEPKHRFALMYLNVDGIALYDALFCQKDGTPPPFAILLQDHGFGGNYDCFGHGGLMEEAATSQAALPQFLLVAENTPAWDGYWRIEGLGPDVGGGGMHYHLRSMFAKDRNLATRRSWMGRGEMEPEFLF